MEVRQKFQENEKLVRLSPVEVQFGSPINDLGKLEAVWLYGCASVIKWL